MIQILPKIVETGFGFRQAARARHILQKFFVVAQFRICSKDSQSAIVRGGHVYGGAGRKHSVESFFSERQVTDAPHSFQLSKKPKLLLVCVYGGGGRKNKHKPRIFSNRS